MKRIALVLGLLAFAGAAEAQTITSYSLAIFIQGGATPISTATLPAANFACGQARITVPPSVANPTRVVIEDPAKREAPKVSFR